MADTYGFQNIGALRNRLQIQIQEPRTAGADGQLSVGGWTVKRTVAAAIRGLSGREAINAQQTKATITHLITIRYQGKDQDGRPFVRPEMRGVDEESGRVFWFTQVLDMDNHHVRLGILALELVTPLPS